MESNFSGMLADAPFCTECSAVREERVCAKGILLLYRLWVCRTGAMEYAVEIATKRETRFAFLGRDLTAASQTFTLLVNGAVTPNTLEDVLEDLAFEACVPQKAGRKG
ncbi:MAG: hypothetical protein IJA78_05330 [Clostridia bacterium]|nr:hypothetical protein [Clostridia bacterium]